MSAGIVFVGVTGNKPLRTEVRKYGRLMRPSRMNEGSLEANAYVPAKDEDPLTTEELEVDDKSQLTSRSNANPVAPQPIPELVKCTDDKRNVRSVSI